MIRIEDVRLPELSPDATEADRRLLQALYDQFRDVGARLGALEATLGTVPRRMSDTITAMPTLTATYVGYGSAANALTGEAAFNYNASTNTLTADNVSDGKGDVRLIPQNSKSAAYTTVLADAGKHLLHPASDANARTFTIDSNANVAYTVGTAITFVNQTSQVLSIAITSDTMTLANSTTTGTRSLAQNGVATALKVSSTGWVISGSGLT